MLDSTATVPHLLDWETLPFGLDPFDPLMDEVQAAGKDRLLELRIPLLASALPRFVTPEVRLRLYDEIDRRSSGRALTEKGRRAIDNAQSALQMLDIPASHLPVAGELLFNELTDVWQERVRQTVADQRVEPAFGLLLGICDGDPGAAAGLAELLRSNPPLAIRTLEAMRALDRPIRALEPWIDTLESRRDWRAVRVLYDLPDHLAGEALEDRATSALRKNRDMAGSLARQIAFSPAADPERRLRAIDLLVALRHPDALEALIERLIDPESEAIVPECARLLATLDDRRVPGCVLALAHRGRLTAGARESVAAALAPSGAWAEIQGHLAALVRGEIELVPDGAGGEPLAKEARERSFHETLGWMRPLDIPVGPRERELDAHATGDDDRWKLAPRADCGGRSALETIAEERRTLWGAAPHLRKPILLEVSRWYVAALEGIARGEFEAARAALRAAVALMPEHVFAQRALERLGVSAS
jgi:hypothetical protein